ncbi:hypothetical protein ACI6QG_18490 [Roseococcus sp. DSY-14]|uniref:hypothetical protein n=1 Tax=Roseococcus sp. DSY-14 TaxID=3369650 RepID=UPI00387B62D2
MQLRSALLVAFIGLVASHDLMAQQPNTGRFCAQGSSAANSASSYIQAVQAVVTNCRAGDTILLYRGLANVVATVCDFSKAIVNTAEGVVCVYLPS